MENLQQRITDRIGIDRLLHFAFGGWMACLAPTWHYALLIGLALGLIKEVFDKVIKKSVFDVWDLIATFIGSIMTGLMLFLGII